MIVKFIGPIMVSAVLCFNIAVVNAASSEDIDKLTTYAVILGRAVACDADVDDASRRVGRWMDGAFPPGSSEQGTYLSIFMEGMRYHALQQREGNSPDSCAAVRSALNKFPWP